MGDGVNAKSVGDPVEPPTQREAPSEWLGVLPILYGVVLGVGTIWAADAIPSVYRAIQYLAGPGILLHLALWRRRARSMGRLLHRINHVPRTMKWTSVLLLMASIGGLAIQWGRPGYLEELCFLMTGGMVEATIGLAVGMELREKGVLGYSYRRRWSEVVGWRWDWEGSDRAWVRLVLLLDRKLLIGFPRRTELGVMVSRTVRDDVDAKLGALLPAPSFPSLREPRPVPNPLRPGSVD